MTNPILKALSAMREYHVRSLLMGGQACILYGGAEFSRDLDLAVLGSAENLEQLRTAMAALQASVIAVPPFHPDHLKRGHAVHFRCDHPEARGLRIDVMEKMRGLDPFDLLWARRTTVSLEPGFSVDLLSLPDLVKAKKTQRDKDWPMIRRLIEADYAAAGPHPAPAQVQFWLLECRSPGILSELAQRYPELCRKEQQNRALLALVGRAPAAELERALLEEQLRERELDRQYWEPLRHELQKLRHPS